MAKGGGKSIWEVIFNVGGKSDPTLKKTFGQARAAIKDLQTASKQLGTDWKSFTGNASKLALGVVGGVAAATTGIVAMANSVAQAGWDAAKAAEATGIGVEAYQELRYAVEQAGVESGMFQSALSNMSRLTREGAAGNEAYSKALAGVGLSANKLAKMAPEKAIERISDYMKKLPGDAERARVASVLFGQSAGPEMMAALKNGSAGIKQLMQEARATGNVIDKLTIEQAGAYMQNQKKLTESMSGMKTQFISGAFGPLTEAFKHLATETQGVTPQIRELGESFGQWLGDAVKQLPEIIAGVKEFAGDVKDTVVTVKDCVGGWENLAKILGALVIAPTLISGLKTIWSTGKLIQTAFLAIKPILAGLSASSAAGGFGAVVAAAAPVVAIIAAIAAVIAIVVHRWDDISAAAKKSFGKIITAIQPLLDKISGFWNGQGGTIMGVLGAIAGFVEDVFVAGITVGFDLIATAVGVGVDALGILWNTAQIVFWPIETIVKVLIGLFEDGIPGALNAAGGQVEKLGTIFGNVFNGMVEIVKKLADLLGGVGSAVKGVVSNLGNKISGLFNPDKNAIPGHADGGIFTHRHIAEIAEQGVEAIVPLNNSREGREIWERAGQLGGYMDASKTVANNVVQLDSARREREAWGRTGQKGDYIDAVKTAHTNVTQINSARQGEHLSASSKAATNNVVQFPVAQVAGQRLSGNGGANVVLHFTQQNTFTGKPDTETIQQVGEAGRAAAPDIERQIDEYFKRKKRVSF